ncbi:MAG: peptidylprolyl isomerase [Bacillaceae bacterium]|nr:peptidylprolyl isomerase [Bacillaceae bacterium]
MMQSKKQMILLLVVINLLLFGCGRNQVAEDDTVTEDEETVQVEENIEEEGTIEDIPAQEELEQIEYPQFINDEQPDEHIVRIKTTKGEITLRLYSTYAPLTVENFLTHSENGYYDGVTFHRVIEDFMIQSGDPTGTGAGGESIYGDVFEDEFAPNLGHFRGAISMANRGPNTNTSQFFIVQNASLEPRELEIAEKNRGSSLPSGMVELYEQYGGNPALDFRHTVFGHVLEGMDVVDEIARTEVDNDDRPKEDIVIETIEILS